MSDLKEKAVTLLSTTVVSLQSTGATTLYTVPTGKRCILDNVKIVCGTLSSPPSSALVTVGQVGALTDFLTTNVALSSLAAQYDMVKCVPVPATTPIKGKSYPATTVIQMNVVTADADGGTDHTVYLFGTLY